MCRFNQIVAALCCLLLTFQSCTKKKESEFCAPVLYGNKMSWADPLWTFSSIDPLTAATPTGTSYTYNGELSPQGAFNTSDNCYYIFDRPTSYTSATLLRKISVGGAVTTFAIDPPYHHYGLVYNQVTNKLYCLRSTISGPQQIVELSMLGTTLTETVLGTPVHSAWEGNVTVDNLSGALYFMSGDTTTHYVERYVPGSATTTVVTSDTSGRWIIGLRFNINDNMLYGIRKENSYDDFSFIKIDVATGSFTTMAPIAYRVNPEFYSACIDPCNNRYLLSTFTGPYWASAFLDEYDMSGTVVNHVVTTPYIFEGMDVKY